MPDPEESDGFICTSKPRNGSCLVAVSGLGYFGVSHRGLQVEGVGFGVWGLGFRVLGFRV